MPSTYLTDIVVQRTAAPTEGGKRVELWDTKVPGLGVRITSNGARSYFYMDRSPIDRSRLRVTIGDCGEMSLAKARQTALDHKAAIRQGQDPRAQKQAAKERAEAKAVLGMEGAVEAFIERQKQRGNRTWNESERILKRYVLGEKTMRKGAENITENHLRNKTVPEVTRRVVVKLLDEVEEKCGFYMANRTLSALSKFFNWAAVERNLIDQSPIMRGMARGKEVEKDRVLTYSEIRLVWAAADATPYPFGPYYKLLLLTAQRSRKELAGMQWRDLDLDAGIWVIPAEKYKTKRIHIIPLTAPVVAILRELHHEGVEPTDYVFSGTDGRAPISGFSKAVRELRTNMATLHTAMGGTPANAPGDDWTPHDFRRTAKSGMSSVGVPDDHSERVLGHVMGKVRGIYDRWAYLPEKRAALDKWTDKVFAILAGEESNVFEFAVAS